MRGTVGLEQKGRKKIKEELRAYNKMRNGRVARDLGVLQGARRENILYGYLTDEQRRSSPKDRATRRAVFWRAPGGVAPQSESTAAILLRRCSREKSLKRVGEMVEKGVFVAPAKV